jgi:adenylylsulfate kinase
MVIWLCGLSGTGKSTLGGLLYERLKPSTPNLVLLDGEDVRAVYGDEHLGHDAESRRRNSVRIAKLCQLLDRQGIHVICCAMTLAPEAQVSNREELAEYYEVLLRVSLPVLASRDPKGIYRRARRGELKNVAGVDLPYVPPANPHLTIDNDADRTDLAPLVDHILSITSMAEVR